MCACWQRWLTLLALATVPGTCSELYSQESASDFPDPVAEVAVEGVKSWIGSTTADDKTNQEKTVITVTSSSTPSEPTAANGDASPIDGGESAKANDADASKIQPVAAEAKGELGDVEVVRERYKNGNIKVEREVALDEDKNYINHGSWTAWSPIGAMTARGQFRFGKPHGDWVRWYEGVPGKLFEDPLYQEFERPFRAEITLRNGQLHGAWTIYDARDRIASSWEFHHNVREGRSVWYHVNGQIAREVEFHGGQLDGELVDRNDKGEITQQTLFVNGRKLERIITTREDGSKIHEGWVLRSHVIHNPKYEWWKAEVTSQPAPQQETQRHGKWVFWHPNGERRVAGQYELGKKTGEWAWWYDNGQRQARGGYKDNLQNGEWVWWHLNGHRRTVGLFEQGETAGVWSSWDDSGKLQSVANYDAPVIEEESKQPPAEVVQVEAPKPIAEVPPPDLQALRHTLESSDTRLR